MVLERFLPGCADGPQRAKLAAVPAHARGVEAAVEVTRPICTVCARLPINERARNGFRRIIRRSAGTTWSPRSGRLLLMRAEGSDPK